MRKFTYSNEIVTVVKKFLEEDDWNYSFDEKTGNFDFGLRLKGKIKKIIEAEKLYFPIPPFMYEKTDGILCKLIAKKT